MSCVLDLDVVRFMDHPWVVMLLKTATYVSLSVSSPTFNGGSGGIFTSKRVTEDIPNALWRTASASSDWGEEFSLLCIVNCL